MTELHAKRLNPPDGEAQPARWARESRVARIEPTGQLVEAPGHLSHRSHAAEPPGRRRRPAARSRSSWAAGPGAAAESRRRRAAPRRRR